MRRKRGLCHAQEAFALCQPTMALAITGTLLDLEPELVAPYGGHTIM